MTILNGKFAVTLQAQSLKLKTLEKKYIFDRGANQNFVYFDYLQSYPLQNFLFPQFALVIFAKAPPITRRLKNFTLDLGYV